MAAAFNFLSKASARYAFISYRNALYTKRRGYSTPRAIPSNALKPQEVGAIGVGGSGENAAGIDAALSLGGIEAKQIEDKTTLFPDPQAWTNRGDSFVVAPGGEIVASPLRNEQGILFVEVDNQRTAIAKRALDIVGHYARPDISSSKLIRGRKAQSSSISQRLVAHSTGASRCGSRWRQERFAMVFRAIARRVDAVHGMAATSAGLTATSKRDRLLSLPTPLAGHKRSLK